MIFFSIGVGLILRPVGAGLPLLWIRVKGASVLLVMMAVF
jgi:hypothetical protein